jgi:cytochrome c oxidase subunit 5b
LLLLAACPQVWWGVIEDGQPPKQIIEGGEFFVLKRLPSSGGHH